MTLQATDEDENAAPIEYYISQILFTSLAKDDHFTAVINASEKIFSIDKKTGELKTGTSLQKYSNGFFEIAILANNTEEHSRRANNTIRVGKTILEMTEWKKGSKFTIFFPFSQRFSC